jgi:hypothetical protein
MLFQQSDNLQALSTYNNGFQTVTYSVIRTRVSPYHQVHLILVESLAPLLLFVFSTIHSMQQWGFLINDELQSS